MQVTANIAKAIYQWWDSSTHEDRVSVVTACGYGPGWADFKSISINQYEMEAYALELQKRGLLVVSK